MLILRSLIILMALAAGALAGWLYHGDQATTVAVLKSGQPVVSTPTGDQALAAPDPALIETTASGPLPKIGKDGRKPMTVYARPFDANDKRPRIAIIVTGLGLRETISNRAIETLPGSISLAFSPYGNDLITLARKARKRGHEVLLSLPMQSNNMALNDSGGRALLVSAGETDNLKRLHWVMSRFTGYVGLMGLAGQGFTGKREELTPVWRDLAARGVFYLSHKDGALGTLPDAMPLTTAPVTYVLDRVPSRQLIELQMRRAEEEAKRAGHVIVQVRAYPLSLQIIREWVASLSGKSLVAVPVSAVVKTAAR